MASIAAGSQVENENFIGAAPETSIAFVKLKEAKPFIRQLQEIPQDSIAYQENDMICRVSAPVEESLRRRRHMDCKEAILSNDYMDFIWKIDVRLTGQAEHPFGVCTQYSWL